MKEDIVFILSDSQILQRRTRRLGLLIGGTGCRHSCRPLPFPVAAEPAVLRPQWGVMQACRPFHSVPETTACVSQSGRDKGWKKKKGRRRDQCPEYGEQQNAPGSQAWWSSPIIPAPGRLWLRTGKLPAQATS